jgi:hypothetical protein
MSSLVRDDYFLFNKNYNNIFQFRYASSLDLIFMLVGTAGGLAHGVLMPLLILVFGGLLNSFTDRTTQSCTYNYTALTIDYCPADYQLTQSNFFSSFS